MRTVRTYAFVAGRWEPTLTVIDVDAALAGKDAILGRIPTSLSGACALPVSIAIDRERGRIFVVNHGGRATPEAVAIMPHGHAGTLAVLDLERALAGRSDALIDEIDAGGHGCVASVLTPDGKYLLVTLAEGAGTEDGGCAIAVFDADTLQLKTRCPLSHSGAPSTVPSPDMSFGRYPNPNGIAIEQKQGLVFTANGGSNDISVLRLSSVIAGDADAEIGRIEASSGPFGLSLHPSGQYLAAADREDARTGALGTTVSFIDLGAAASPATGAVTSAHVGTRPFVPAFSPDGGTLYVSCQATGTVSVVDVDAALAQKPDAVRQIELKHPSGAPASPRGLAVSADGGLIAVSGGAKNAAETGAVWLIQSEYSAAAAVVTGAGNEPYLVELASFS